MNGTDNLELIGVASIAPLNTIDRKPTVSPGVSFSKMKAMSTMLQAIFFFRLWFWTGVILVSRRFRLLQPLFAVFIFAVAVTTFSASFRRLFTVRIVTLGFERLGSDSVRSSYVSIALIRSFDDNEVLHYFCPMAVSALCFRNVAIGAMNDLEVKNLLDSTSEASSKPDKFSIGTLNASPTTSIRGRSNVTWSTTLYTTYQMPISA